MSFLCCYWLIEASGCGENFGAGAPLFRTGTVRWMTGDMEWVLSMETQLDTLHRYAFTPPLISVTTETQILSADSGCFVNNVFRLFGTIPSILAVEWPTVPITVLNINIYASIAHRKYTITPLSHWCIAYILSLPAFKNKKDQKSFVLFFCVTEETTSLLVPTHQDRHVVTVPVPATTSCAVSFKQPSLLWLLLS